MSERNSEIKRKIHNVKEWLNSAEDSFKQDQDIKGQLNLMLAQAEMQTLSKANDKWYKRRIYVALLAITIALTTGIVYNFFTKDEKVDTIIRSNFQPRDEKKSSLETNELKVKELKQVEQATDEPNTKEPAPKAPGQNLTEVEKRNLIRQAQQSLHGELKR